MKVALVSDTFEIGGGLEHLYQTAKGLPEIRFCLFARGGREKDKFSNLDNAEVFTQGYGPDQIIGAGPDLIHFHHFRPLFNFYKNPLFSSPLPVLFTAHGLHIRKYSFLGGKKNHAKRLLRSITERYLLSRVDTVIAVSEEDTRFLKEKYGLRNTLTITYGLDLKAFSSEATSKMALRRELDLPTAETIFLTVARFDYQKGYDVLVKAIESGQEEFRKAGVLFVWVGGGRELYKIKSLARKAGIRDLIRFMGERSDSYRLMRAGDLVILPSRWEGLPITLIEAALCNLRVVASDTCGNREIVSDSGQGILFRNEDSRDLCRVLLSLLGSRFSGKRTKGPGLFYPRAFREKYDITTVKALLKSEYMKLLHQK